MVDVRFERVTALPAITAPDTIYYVLPSGGAEAEQWVTGTSGSAIPVSVRMTFARLINKPTTLAGYGITDAIQTGTPVTAAQQLATPRLINGVAFDGTADITVPSVAADATTLNGQPGSYYRAFANLTGKPTTLAGYGITDAQSATGSVAWGRITGTPTTLAGYGITDAQSATGSVSWSRVTERPTTLAGYGITDAQPLDPDLTAIAALATTSFGRSQLTLADAAGGRTAFQLGTASTLNTGTTSGTIPLIGANGKLAAALMPAVAITDTFVVASQSEQVALVAERGDVAIRTDLNKSFILRADDPTVFANWQELLAPTGGGGSTGTVTTVSVVTANGISGTVQNASTTPAITLALGAITPSSVAATGNVTGANLSGTNTGDQTITLTGDVTGSGTGSFAATIGNGVVTLAKQANVPTGTVFYRKTTGSGAPEVQTLATLKSDLGLSVATDALGAVTPAADRVPYFTSGTAAAVTTLTSYGRTLIALTDAAGLTAQTNVVSTTAKGAVPQLPGNTTTFFRGDGTFATPPGEARAQTLCSVYDGTGSPTYDFYYADVAQTLSYKYLTNTTATPAAVVMRSTAANPTSFATVVNNPANGQTGSFTMEAGASVYFMTASSGLHWLHLKRTST